MNARNRLPRGEEQWARSILERVLHVPVEHYDDGSKSAMYDLRVPFPDSRMAAVEVTAAVEPESTEFWNIVTGEGRWIFEGLEGGWAIHVEPSARAKRLYENLPDLLRSFEDAGIREYRPIPGAPRSRLGLADQLGINHAHQGGTDTPGSVYVYPDLPPERVSGMVADTGDALADWLGGFLAEPERDDVRQARGIRRR